MDCRLDPGDDLSCLPLLLRPDVDELRRRLYATDATASFKVGRRSMPSSSTEMVSIDAWPLVCVRFIPPSPGGQSVLTVGPLKKTAVDRGGNEKRGTRGHREAGRSSSSSSVGGPPSSPPGASRLFLTPRVTRRGWGRGAPPCCCAPGVESSEAAPTIAKA